MKKRLDEITLMRCILALLIVFMHAFTCYQGGWTQPEGYVDIPVYKWIARTSFAFTLEAFVFISGYLFAFQSIFLKRTGGRMSLILNKLKRLILPSVIFSVLYFPLFYDYKGILDLLYNLINGCGHMWFLPMLFWCFIGAWLVEKLKISDGWKLVFFVCLNLFWPITLPFQISRATNYLVYFYGGYMVFKNAERIKSIITDRRIIWSWIAFAVLFVILRPLMDVIDVSDSTNRLDKWLSSSLRDVCQLIYASVGTLTFYITAIWYTHHNKLHNFTNKLASCCFGIYLFQQFILKGMYYKTDFSSFVGPYWLPWIGFVIATLLSYILTVLFLETRIGRFLVG